MKTFLTQLWHRFTRAPSSRPWAARFQFDDTFGHFWMADAQGQWYAMRYNPETTDYSISYDGVRFKAFDVDTHAAFLDWYQVEIVRQSSLHYFFSRREAFFSFILTCMITQKSLTNDNALIFPYQAQGSPGEYRFQSRQSVTSGSVWRYAITVDHPHYAADIQGTQSYFLLRNISHCDSWQTAFQLQQRISLLNRFIQRIHARLDVLIHPLLTEQNFLLHPQSKEMFEKYETLHAMDIPVDPLTLVRTYNQISTEEVPIYL